MNGLNSADSLATFLLDAPEGAIDILALPPAPEDWRNEGNSLFKLPSLILPCSNSLCHQKPLIHELKGYGFRADDDDDNLGFELEEILVYECTHCKQNRHRFAVVIEGAGAGMLTIRKFGQIPPRGGPMPAVILNQADDECKALLRKGLECERHSLGVGALAYYRKAFEGMRERIFKEVQTVCTNGTQRKAIERALKEPRFNESFRIAAVALPESLKGSGNNALTLLYSALSTGIHDGPTDEECLEVAQSTLLAMIALLRGIRELRAHAKQAEEARSKMAKFLKTTKAKKNAASVGAARQQPPTQPPTF